MVLEDDQSNSYSMFGAFALRNDMTPPAFSKTFSVFCRHLQEQGYVRDWRVWIRRPHAGYDNRAPDVPILVEIEFCSRSAALECYAYVEADQEPLKTLHRDMNRMVHDTFFALYEKLSSTV